MNGHPLAADLDQILKRTEPMWEELRGQRVFVTGGTGFFGCWLLESFAWANQHLALGAKMIVLTRHPDVFRQKAPRLAARTDIQLHSGDVTDFEFPGGTFSHVVHLATESIRNPSQEAAAIESIVRGTRRALEFAVERGAKKFLLASSGAVYGVQPSDVTHVTEDYAGSPDLSNPSSAYGEAKRVSELLCAMYAKENGIETKIARGFAFVGPYLALDAHFAIGNFIRDAMAGGPIRVNGDGTPFRSYLYAGDLAAWLWTILFRGRKNRPYNVGSSQALTIAETAAEVARALGGKIEVAIAKKPEPGRPASRYVPNINRAAEELKLDQWTALDDAIRATARWHRANQSP